MTLVFSFMLVMLCCIDLLALFTFFRSFFVAQTAFLLGIWVVVCNRFANVLEVKMLGILAESVSVPKNATLTLRGSMNCPSALSVDFSAACMYLINSAACSRK